MRYFTTLRLLYDLFYYTSSVVISAADPISDLILGLLYLSREDTVFGIATLVVCFLPGVLLSALSFQWIVYDSTLASVLNTLSELDSYHIPQDYTHYFLETDNKEESTQEGKTYYPKGGESNYTQILSFTSFTKNQDVVMHPPETMDQVAVDSPVVDTKSSLPKRPRPRRDTSQISVDAGLSKYPLIVTGTIDRKDVYKKTCQELRITPIRPSCSKVSAVEIVFHGLGLPGITRYASLFFKAIRMHKKRGKLSEKYELFVQEAGARGIKEVYFNKDLLELYHGRRDAALLRLVEGALEATPQLLLQLYIIVKHTGWETGWFTYASVACSFISVVWSMTSYIYEHRAASYDKGSMSPLSYGLTVLIKLCMCLSRITAILLAATYSGWLVLGVCSAHWVSCLIYVCHAKTHFYGGLVWNEWFFKFISSITLVLTFMNIVEGSSRKRWFVYHTYILLQNLGMLTCWYLNHEPDPLKPDWYSAMLIGLVIGGMFLGSLLTLLYYRCLHPSENLVLETHKIVPVLEEIRKKYSAVAPAKERETTLLSSV